MLKSYEKKLNAYNSNTKLFIESFIEYLNRFEKVAILGGLIVVTLQNYKMLLSIVKIAKKTPSIKHWLPTKEYTLITRYHKEFGNFPKNLCTCISTNVRYKNKRFRKYIKH